MPVVADPMVTASIVSTLAFVAVAGVLVNYGAGVPALVRGAAQQLPPVTLL